MKIPFSHRFIFQFSPEGMPSGEHPSQTKTSFNPYERPNGTPKLVEIELPAGETTETLHYKLHGYQVKPGDTLSGIIKDGFGEDIDYEMSVWYVSSKLPQSQKPTTVKETNTIFPGQYIYWSDTQIVIADDRDFTQNYIPPTTPEEEETPPPSPKPTVISEEEVIEEDEEGEDIAPKQKPSSEEEGSQKAPQKPQPEYLWSGEDFKNVNTSSDVLVAVEEKFHQKGVPVPKSVLLFLEKNNLPISPQQIYVNDEGFAAFPLETDPVGTSPLQMTILVDRNSTVRLYDDNVDQGKPYRLSSDESINPREYLSSAYASAVYDGILSQSIRENVPDNIDENINKYIPDTTLAKIIELYPQPLVPVTPELQKEFRAFVDKWIDYADIQRSTDERNLTVAEVMSDMVHKNGYDSPLEESKIKKLVRGELFRRPAV